MADIEEILLRVSASTGDVDAKLSAIERRLKELEGERARPEVDPKTDDAKAKLAEIRNNLRAIAAETARAHVSVEGAEAAKREVNELEHALGEISHEGAGARIRLDDALARAEIDRLKLKLDELDRPHTVTIRANTDKLREDLAAIGERASSIPRLLATFGPALIPMIGTLAQGALGAGALAIAAGGAAAAFGALGLGVKAALGGAQLEQVAMTQAQQRLTDAIKTGSAAQIASARAGVAAVQQQVNANFRAVNALKTAWTTVQGTILQVMAGGIRDVEQGFTGMIQFIGPQLGQLRGPFEQLGQAVKDALASPEVRQGVSQLITDFGRLVQAAAPLAGPLLQAMTKLGDLLLRIAIAAMPALVKLVQQFADWLGKVDAASPTKLQATVNRLIGQFLDVVKAVVAVIRALAPLVSMSSVLLPFVQVIAAIVGAFLRLLQVLGPLGQLIAGGLGIVFLITKLSGLFAIIREGIVAFAALKAGLLGLEVAAGAGGLAGAMGKLGGATRGVFSAIKALITGEGIAGAIAAYKGMTGATRAAETAERDLIPTKGKEKVAAEEASVADTALSRATSLVAKAAPVAALAVAGAAATIAAKSLEASHAASNAWQGIVTAMRNVARPVAAAATQVAAQGASALRSSAPIVSSAATTAWRGITVAAQNIAGPVRQAASTTMSAGSAAIRQGGPAVQAAATGSFGLIPYTLNAQQGPVHTAGTGVMFAGVSALHAGAPAVASAGATVWDHVRGSLADVAPKVGLAALAVMGVGAAALLTAAPLIATAAANTSERIPSAVRAVGPGVGAAGSAVMSALQGAISAGANAVGGAAQNAASQIRAPIEALGSGLAGVGASIMQSIAAGITSNAGAAVAAASSAAAAIRGAFPGSEPKDPASPLRNLAGAGRAIVTNLAAGIQAGPVQAALMRALALPHAGLGVSIPIGMQGAGAAAAGAGGVALTTNLTIQALHAGDPTVQRQIANTVTAAQRRALPQRPPVRA